MSTVDRPKESVTVRPAMRMKKCKVAMRRKTCKVTIKCSKKNIMMVYQTEHQLEEKTCSFKIKCSNKKKLMRYLESSVEKLFVDIK